MTLAFFLIYFQILFLNRVEIARFARLSDGFTKSTIQVKIFDIFPNCLDD